MKILAKYVGLCAAGLASVLFSPPAAAQVWQEICSEGKVCPVDGTRPLRFGAGNKFNYGVATGSVRCSAETFGDPAPDAAKRCFAYYTAGEVAVVRSHERKDERIRALEQEVRSMQAELDEANAEIDDLYRELRRDRRRDLRREQRRDERRQRFNFSVEPR